MNGMNFDALIASKNLDVAMDYGASVPHAPPGLRKAAQMFEPPRKVRDESLGYAHRQLTRSLSGFGSHHCQVVDTSSLRFHRLATVATCRLSFGQLHRP